MKQLLLICVVVALVGGCGGEKEDGNTGVVNPNKPSPKAIPEKLIADSILEKQIREALKKPEGELTKADLKKVTGISLHSTQVTDAVLKEVAKLQNLEDLDLGDTQVTDAVLKEVAKLKKLTHLSLSGTKTTDAGLKEVAKLQKLKLLSVADTKVTKAGVAEFKKALPNCNIFGP